VFGVRRRRLSSGQTTRAARAQNLHSALQGMRRQGTNIKGERPSAKKRKPPYRREIGVTAFLETREVFEDVNANG
jgi:hypothetical protein